MKAFWKKHKKKILVAAGVVVIVLIIIAAASKHNGNGFETYTAAYADITEEVEVAGQVESNDFAELAFEVSGRVNAINVEVGDEVRRGETLMRLDTAELAADLLDAQALVDIKQANLENATTNLDDIIKQQDVIVESARQKLLSADLVVEPESNSNTLDAPTITGNYKGPEGYYKIIFRNGVTFTDPIFRTFGVEEYEGEIEEIVSKPLGTYGLYIQATEEPTEYVDTVWYVYLPNTRGSNYTTNLAAYEKAIEDRNVAISEAQRSLNQGDRENSIALAELQQAQARVRRIQAQIAQRTIRAPFDGVISAVDAEVGEIASSGSKVVSIVSGGDFEVVLDVPEIDVSKLEVGNMVDITLDAFGSREVWQGEILAISQAETYVDGVPVYETRVAFVTPDERVRSGLSTTVTIATETRTNVLAVPIEFIDRDENGEFVNILIDEETTERRNVETGLRGSNGLVEIISGVEEGEIVSTRPVDA